MDAKAWFQQDGTLSRSGVFRERNILECHTEKTSEANCLDLVTAGFKVTSHHLGPDIDTKDHLQRLSLLVNR